MEKIRSTAIEFGQLAIDTLSQPQILWQLVAIGVLFIPAWFLSSWIEPKLEQRARGIRGMPGLLRIIIAFLRRFEWVFYVLLLAATYTIATALEVPGNSYIVYSVMLLSGAWLLISVVSHAMRSRLLRQIFAFAAWAFVAATILGITDDIAALLDSAGFNLGNFRLSILTAVQAALILGVALWLSFSLSGFFDRR
ncbi:MAG: mechanosensitive ion channel family protein, partial [Gammaproteobacteria bacterium]|nr:mechanosensitive ion channel family protein [Gammaproteobacteria bacterium]